MMGSAEYVEHATVGGPVDDLKPLMEILGSFVVQLRRIVHPDTSKILGDGRPDARK